MATRRADGRRWHTLKRRIIRRDAGICHICGGEGADSADHIIPAAHGGPLWDPNNLKAVHHNTGPRCNRVRGDRPIELARTEIAALTNQPDDWDW